MAFPFIQARTNKKLRNYGRSRAPIQVHRLTASVGDPIVHATSGEPEKAFFRVNGKPVAYLEDAFRRCPRNGDRVKP
jgi:hypothetical protein